MKILILALICATLLTGCLNTSLETTLVPVEMKGWEGRGVDLGSGRGTITEYHPPGESFESWSQLATVQFLEGNQSSVREVMEELREVMQARASADVSVNWTVLEETDSSITYEWSISGSTEHSDQVELARLLLGNDGLHRVAFAQRGTAISGDDRARWREALARAEVFKGEQRVVLESD